MMIGGAAGFFILIKRYLFGKTVDVVKALEAKNNAQDLEIRELKEKLNTALNKLAYVEGKIGGRIS